MTYGLVFAEIARSCSVNIDDFCVNSFEGK